MRHLYNCRVQILELRGSVVHGIPVMEWRPITAIADPVLGVAGEMMCRLDIGFVRPGRDQPMPISAGRAPDRVGVLIYDPTPAVKAGQRIRVLTGPVTGTFELRSTPDPAQAMPTVPHHMEVQVIEVAQELAGTFPGTTPEVDLP